MVPPSYEGAVENNKVIGNSQTSTEVVPFGARLSLHRRLTRKVMKMRRQLHNPLHWFSEVYCKSSFFEINLLRRERNGGENVV